MGELAYVVSANLDLTVETEVLSYTYSGATIREVMARVDLGDSSKPIAGTGTYLLRFYLNNVLVTPESRVSVPSGVTRTIMVSRAVPIRTGDVVKIKVLGLPADHQVNAVASLRDATPVTLSDITGPGAVEVDHDYGGVDNLAYQTIGGVGVEDAELHIFSKSDWDDNNRTSSYVIAASMTGPDQGRWIRSVMLSPGEYVIRAFKLGAFGPDTKELTVVA